MPHGDGTGPVRGGGPGSGRSLGMRNGAGRGTGRGTQHSAVPPLERVASALGTFVGSVQRSHASSPAVQAPQPQRKAISSVAKKAVVDEVRCSGCGICIRACAAGAISMEHFATIDTDTCMGCGDCVVACPRGAISLQELLPKT